MYSDETKIERLSCDYDRTMSGQGCGGMYCTEQEYLADERAAAEWFNED